MTEEDISQECRLKKIKKIDNYFIKEIDQNELLSNKNKKICATLSYIAHFITLVFSVTVYIFISAFASLIDISLINEFYNRIKYLCNNCKYHKV